MFLALVLNCTRPKTSDSSTNFAADKNRWNSKQRTKNNTTSVCDELLYEGLEVKFEWFFSKQGVPFRKTLNASTLDGGVLYFTVVPIDETREEHLRLSCVVVVLIFCSEAVVQCYDVLAGAIECDGF